MRDCCRMFKIQYGNSQAFTILDMVYLSKHVSIMFRGDVSVDMTMMRHSDRLRRRGRSLKLLSRHGFWFGHENLGIPLLRSRMRFMIIPNILVVYNPQLYIWAIILMVYDNPQYFG